METSIAQKVTDTMLKTIDELNQSLYYVQENGTDEDFKGYRKAIGRVVGAIILDVLNPLFEMNPEVKPESFKD